MLIFNENLTDQHFDISDSFVTCYIKGQDKNLGAIVDYPVIIICPGGSYRRISSRDSEIIALNFMAKGYHVFVLNYSHLPTDKLYPKPLVETAKVFSIIEKYSKKYHVNTQKIVLAGFSAGGHVASLYTGMNEAWIRNYTDAKVIKPYRQLLCYPLIDYKYTTAFSKEEIKQVLGDFTDGAADSLVSKNTPPTFIWATRTDELVSSQSYLVYLNALEQNNINYEAHIFGWGPHGLSLANEQTNYLPEDKIHADRQFLNSHAAKWFDLAIEWLNTDNFGIK